MFQNFAFYSLREMCFFSILKTSIGLLKLDASHNFHNVSFSPRGGSVAKCVLIITNLYFLLPDTFFLVMIVMVCLSVFCTVLVIQIGSSARHVPRLVRWLFLDIIPPIVCLRHLDRSQILLVNGQKVNPVDAVDGEHTVLHNSNDDEASSEYRNEHLSTTRVSNHHHQQQNHHRSTSTKVHHCRCCSSSGGGSDTKKQLEYLVKDIHERKLSEAIRSDWQCVAVVVDRCLLIIFIVFSLVATLTLAVAIFNGTNLLELEFPNSTELIVINKNLR